MFGTLRTRDDAFKQFWFGVSDAQRRRILDLFMARMSEPDPHERDFGCNEMFWQPKELIEQYAPAAREVFAERRGLKVWQYACALKMANLAALPFGIGTDEGVQREMFLALAEGDETSFAERADAFTAIFSNRTEEELDFFAEHLALIPDSRLISFLHRYWWRARNLDRMAPDDAADNPDVPYRERMHERIAAVRDDALRERLASNYR